MDSYYSVIVLFNIMYLEIVSFFTTVEYSTEWMALRMWANSSQIKLSYAEIIKNTPEGVKNTPEGGKNCQQRILCTANYPSRMKTKLRQLPDKYKLTWLISSKSALEETVQWALQVEMKGLNSNLKPHKEIKVFSKGSHIGKY